MWELCECIKLAVDADHVNLYLVESEGEITKYSPDKQELRQTYQIGEGTTVAAFTAASKHETRVTLPCDNKKHPHGVAGQKVEEFILKRPDA